MGPIWGPPGSCRPQMGPMLAPWTLLSGKWSLIFMYTPYMGGIMEWYSSIHLPKMPGQSTFFNQQIYKFTMRPYHSWVFLELQLCLIKCCASIPFPTTILLQYFANVMRSMAVMTYAKLCKNYFAKIWINARWYFLLNSNPKWKTAHEMDTICITLVANLRSTPYFLYLSNQGVGSVLLNPYNTTWENECILYKSAIITIPILLKNKDE